MTKISDFEDNLETLEDASELAEQIGSESEDTPAELEDDVFNAKFEHAEQKIAEGGDSEYHLLDDAAFDVMEFESWTEEDVVPAVENIHELRKNTIELAFGDLAGHHIEAIRERIQYRDLYAALELQKAGFEDEDKAIRLRGYFQSESGPIKTYLEQHVDLSDLEAVVPAKYTETDTEKIIEQTTTTDQHIDLEGETNGE